MYETQITESAAALEVLRSEINELKAVEDATDEQATRMDVVLTEWDTAEAAHNALVERAEKLSKIEGATIREAVGAPAVHVNRNDPFENLTDLQWRSDKDPELRERALRAFEDTKHRGLKDSELEALIGNIESIPGAARHALIVGSDAYRSAFVETMRAQGGQPIYTPEQAEAMRTAMSLSGANGGYLLPTLLDPTLIHTGAATKDPIRQLATVKTGTVNVWHGVTVGNVTSYWTAEAATTPEGSPTLGSPSVTAAKLTAYVTGSYEVFEDTGLQSELPGLITESMGYKENTAFISGSGSNAPRGIVTAISGTAGSTVTATTRGAFTTASAVDVFALLNSLPSRYEDSATWLANKQTFNTIKQMSTASNGSYFWSDFNAGIGAPLLGSPIAQASDMPSATTSGTVLAVLGDFSRYVIYDRIGIQVEFVQNIFDQATGLPTGQRGYVAHKRVGGDVTDVDAFRFLKT
jgi:HK97 family phage major capsid protein